MNKFYIYIILLCIGCKRPPAPSESRDIRGHKGNVLITNEGLFQWGQAEIGLYNKFEKSFTGNCYQLYNKRKLGDVLQSVSEWNDRLYLVINNSGKIEIIDKSTLQAIGSISGLRSPRRIVFYRDTKAYITDLYQNGVTVYNLLTNEVIKTIAIQGWTEAALIIGNKVYITAPKRNYIYRINADTDVLEDSIETLYGGESFEVDRTGKIWEACMGDSVNAKPAGLIAIDPNQWKVVKKNVFSGKNESASRLCINVSREKLYYINHDIFAYDIISDQTEKIFNGNKRQLYGLGFDSEKNELYIGDAVDFISNGKVFRTDLSSKMIVDSFSAGVIPNGFYFIK